VAYNTNALYGERLIVDENRQRCIEKQMLALVTVIWPKQNKTKTIPAISRRDSAVDNLMTGGGRPTFRSVR